MCIRDRPSGPVITAAASESFTVSTIHTEWTFRSFQQINDMLVDGVSFYPGYNRNGVNFFGDRIRVKNSTFRKFKRVAVRFEGKSSVLEDCVIQEYDNDNSDTLGTTWAAVILGGDAAVIMNRVVFDNEPSLLGTTAVVLEDTASLNHSYLEFENYTATVTNTGTGTTVDNTP